MVDNEPKDPNPSDDPQEGELPAACQEARQEIASFVGPKSAQRGQGSFREHLTGCPECMGIYRQAMGAAARMGRTIREERGEEERHERHAGMVERAKKAGEPMRRNRFALRLALLPAAFALLIFMQRALKPGEGMTLHWDGGEVHAGAQRLSKDFPKRVLNEPGMYCLTKGNARAEIFAHTDPEAKRFDLGLETTVQVVDPKRIELRLASGELLIFGEARVHSQFGLVEVLEGEAKLTVKDLKLRVECQSGELRVVTPVGEETLTSGMSVERPD